MSHSFLSDRTSYKIVITAVMAPVDPHGEADQPAGVELVEGILFPEPSQSQPSTILGWNLSSVRHLDITAMRR